MWLLNCDCGDDLCLPLPKRICTQPDQFDLDNALQEGKLDYVHFSLHSMPSMNQPGHCSCVIKSTSKWSWDENIRNMINAVHVSMGFPKLVKLDSTR